MNLSKVKLVVSDMDGTLLNSKGEVSKLFFDLFKKLQKHHIHFCAASGRQYSSIVHKLDPIRENITIIAENGGIVKQQDNILLLNKLAPKKITEIIPILRTIKDTYIVLCGKDTAYIETTDKKFISMFEEYYTTFKIVPDLTKVISDTDFLKIAIYHFKSSEKHIYPKIEYLKNKYLLKISGTNWLDISDVKANKGNALRAVQKKLNITKEETMVFGDYHNDLEMLQEANFSFAMKNAHKDIKKKANYGTESNDNFGVERILEKLIEARETTL
tara:strand:- start:2638 stop:3456 length:819 start_codon:yes stop_codon:yes gene_type:complete